MIMDWVYCVLMIEGPSVRILPALPPPLPLPHHPQMQPSLPTPPDSLTSSISRSSLQTRLTIDQSQTWPSLNADLPCTELVKYCETLQWSRANNFCSIRIILELSLCTNETSTCLTFGFILQSNPIYILCWYSSILNGFCEKYYRYEFLRYIYVRFVFCIYNTLSNKWSLKNNLSDQFIVWKGNRQ